MQAYIKDSGFRQYCIDGMSPNNALGVADRYVYVSPYASLSEAEAGQIFFALLSLEVSQGGSQDINKALNQLNVAAASIGLTPMGRTMSKDDLSYICTALPPGQNIRGYRPGVIMQINCWKQLGY